MSEEISYEEKIKKYSLVELEDVRRNIDKDGCPERYELVLKEIEKRKETSSSQITVDSGAINIFSSHWNSNVVDDISSPQLYSKRVVYVFSVLFAVVFGGVLFISNLKTLQNYKSIKIIWVYIILYTIFTLVMIFNFPNTGNLALLLNIGGAIPLYSYFWKKFIGAQLKYRKKSFVKPLLISLAVVIPFVIANFF